MNFLCYTAHRFSRVTIDQQRDEFKQWGVMADWDNPYITSDASFVQNELDVFQKLYDMVSEQPVVAELSFLA